MNNYTGNDSGFYTDLMALRKSYVDLFDKEAFISGFRDYYKRISNVLDAAESSSVVTGNAPRRDLFVLDSPELFDAICNRGDLDTFIGHSTAISLAKFLIKYKDSPKLSRASKETALGRIAVGAAELPEHDILQLVETFWMIINSSPSLQDLFLSIIKYDHIPRIQNEQIQKETFLGKTKRDKNLGKSWLKTYVQMLALARMEARVVLIQIFEKNRSFFNNLNRSEKDIIYSDLFDFYAEKNNIWDSEFISNWLPDDDPYLGKFLVNKMHSGIVDATGFARHMIVSGDNMKFAWLLSQIDFDQRTFRSLYDEIVKASQYPRVAYIGMYNDIYKKLGEIDLEKEKEFAYNMFPVSGHIQNWVYEKLSKSDIPGIRKYFDRLLQHPQLTEGLAQNAALRRLLVDINFAQLFDEASSNSLPTKFLYVTLLGKSKHNSHQVLTFLISRLPATGLVNDLLVFIAKNRLYKSIPEPLALEWLSKTYGKLRSDYIERGIDTLHQYISGLDNCTDDMLWQIVVVEPILGKQNSFSWQTYISSMPASRGKNTNYSEYYSIVNRLPPIDGDRQNYLRRLEVCRDLAMYRRGERTQTIINHFKEYRDSVADDPVLISELQKVLEPILRIQVPRKTDAEAPITIEPKSISRADTKSIFSRSTNRVTNNSQLYSNRDMELKADLNDSGEATFHFEDIMVFLALIIMLPFTIYTFLQWTKGPTDPSMLTFFLISAVVTFLLVLYLLVKVCEWVKNTYLK